MSPSRQATEWRMGSDLCMYQQTKETREGPTGEAGDGRDRHTGWYSFE